MTVVGKSGSRRSQRSRRLASVRLPRSDRNSHIPTRARPSLQHNTPTTTTGVCHALVSGGAKAQPPSENPSRTPSPPIRRPSATKRSRKRSTTPAEAAGAVAATAVGEGAADSLRGISGAARATRGIKTTYRSPAQTTSTCCTAQEADMIPLRWMETTRWRTASSATADRTRTTATTRTCRMAGPLLSTLTWAEEGRRGLSSCLRWRRL
jgi:hypothetical protein